MGRIPEGELERIKAEVSVQRLAEARGVELRRRGADLVGRCPFHDDRTPSMVISPEQNLWHCLGACQAGGSCIDWVMRERGVSFRHAVELLRADLPSVAGNGQVRGATVRTLPAPVDVDADDQELLQQVVAFYHRTLRDSPEALQYLERRGLRDDELIERWRLGFANRTLGLRLPLANRKDGADIRGRLQRLGVIRETGHEHFNGSLVVPVLDEEGRVLELYGRKITAGLRAGTPLHLYLPGPHRGVWNAAALSATEEVIVTEALLDALTLWRHGLRHVTAAYGVEGFTAEHLDVLTHAGIRRALIAYDRDEAGDRAAVQLGVRLVAAGIDSYRVVLPQGHDVNSFACEQRESAQVRLAERLRHAVWLGQGQPADDAPVPDDTAPGEPADAEPTDPSPVLPSVAQPEPPSDDVTTPPATPQPEAPRETPVEVRGDEVLLRCGDRHWRIRGALKATSFDALRVNVLVSRGERTTGTPFHVDTFDLYAARQRAAFAVQAANELGVGEAVIRSDLGTVLLHCEAVAQEAAQQAKAPQVREPLMSDAEQREALQLLRDPQLLQRVLDDLERIGVVGEESNKLVAYLAATSRLLDSPLAVIIQSTTAAGKSALLEAVLALLPEEARSKYSAMTGQSLYYMSQTSLAHKVLAVVEEEGAERAAYALKLLQSEGELRIASTGKDPQTGRLVTQEYEVQGPVAIFLTTTAVDVDEELLNRCVVLAVDEEREQTRAIHERQRHAETLAGLLRQRERTAVLRLHHNVQRLLRPLLVANPYAERLTFSDQRTRSRRDHTKYLTLIRTVALLHQFQRPTRTVTHRGERVEYIEVTLDDIAVANRLADTVLGRSVHELPPQTQRLLLTFDELVCARCETEALERSQARFSRRELRELTGLSDSHLKRQLHRLVDLEYVDMHRSPRGVGVTYELRWDGRGRDGASTLSGLIDPAALDQTQAYDGGRSRGGGGSAQGRSTPGSPPAHGRLRVQRSGNAQVQQGESPPIASNGRETQFPGDTAASVVRTHIAAAAVAGANHR